MQTRRAALEKARTDDGVRRDDAAEFSKVITPEIRSDLLSQCVRRLAAGMRDWASLLGVSSDGRSASVALGEVRLRLLHVSTLPDDGQQAALVIDSLRRHVQLLAYAFELSSSGELGRPGVITARDPDRPSSTPDPALVALLWSRRGEPLSAILRIAMRTGDA